LNAWNEIMKVKILSNVEIDFVVREVGEELDISDSVFDHLSSRGLVEKVIDAEAQAKADVEAQAKADELVTDPTKDPEVVTEIKPKKK
jgi:hypothetical protein